MRRVAGEPALAFLNRSTAAGQAVRGPGGGAQGADSHCRPWRRWTRRFGEGSATRVYDARDALVDQYADLAHDKDLIARMTAANELIRRAVVVDATRRPAERAPRPDPLGPPTSLVLRSSRDAGAAPSRRPRRSSSPWPTDFALRDRRQLGAPLWHVPLGLASPFVPRAVTGEATVLAFDARHDELVKLDAHDRLPDLAARRWANRSGDPPLVLGNQLFQVLPERQGTC